MKKTHKKIDNTLRVSLTKVCDSALENVAGFKWLTHLADYDNFPRSLKVICVFDTNKNQTLAEQQGRDAYLCDLIKRELLKENIKLADVNRQVKFDSEERCANQHGGDWSQRLRKG